MPLNQRGHDYYDHYAGRLVMKRDDIKQELEEYDQDHFGKIDEDKRRFSNVREFRFQGRDYKHGINPDFRTSKSSYNNYFANENETIDDIFSSRRNKHEHSTIAGALRRRKDNLVASEKRDSHKHRRTSDRDTIKQCGRIYPCPDNITRRTFDTTGIIVSRKVCVKVTSMLFDTGASSTMISPQVVQAAKLQMLNCHPKRFQLGDGSYQTVNKFVELHLFIAGIDQQIEAFVDEEYSGCHLLIGQPALAQFSVRSNHCFGSRQEQRWTIAQNTTGLRRRRVILTEDPEDAEPSLRVYRYEKGLRIAMRPGETATERKSREILERSEARHARLKARHHHRVADRYDEYDDGFDSSTW